MSHLFKASTALLLVLSVPARAGDKPLVAAVPEWAVPAPEDTLKNLPASGNVLPLFDEQVLVQGDTVTAYFDAVTVISSPEVLNRAGTITIPWRPDHGDVTLHRIDILRNGQRIDVLDGGAGFTVLRREAGLENLMVDGQLTAVKHLEGLRVGDSLRLTFSLSSTDHVLQGNVQDALLLLPAPARLGFARARLVWPKDRQIAWKSLMPGLTASAHPIAGDRNELLIPLPVAKLPEMPKNYPSRFAPVPAIQFSSFQNWGDVAAVMSPLYRTAGAITPGSDLARAVDAIAARSGDPVRRMADALQLVQDDVRYQLMAFGNGNYVPQPPSETWSKRYGDCKAKTMLLLAVLDRLGIAAEPVLANIKRGDAVKDALPSLQAFDHVFVRAHAGGEDFWLDGTMLGSRLADIRDVPRYGYVLPLTGKDAAVTELPVRANARPGVDVDLAYDMSVGPHLPAPFTLKIRYAGSWGEANKVAAGPDYDERLQKFADDAANNWVSSTTISRPRVAYDPSDASWTLTVDGVGYPDWKFEDGHYQLGLPPALKIVLDADRSRSTWKGIPALIAAPWTAHSHLGIRLPSPSAPVGLEGTEPAKLANSAVEWTRTLTRTGNDLVEDIVSRESGGEIAPADLSAVTRSINDAMARNVRISLPPTYPASWDDVARLRSSPAMARVRAVFDQRIADKPDEAVRYSDRAWLATRLLDWTSAEADYSKAIALDGTAARYLDRANLRVKRGDHAGALADAQKAYDLEQGNKDARDLLATELAEAGKVDEGLDLLDGNPDVMTDDGMSAFVRRIVVLETGNRHDEAMALLDDTMARHSTRAELFSTRCWYKALRNTDLAGALSDCNRAQELSSDPADVFDSRAMVHFRSGELREAKADLDAALSLAPEQTSSLFMRGIVLQHLGNAGEGAKQIEAARKSVPNIDHFFQRFDIHP